MLGTHITSQLVKNVNIGVCAQKESAEVSSFTYKLAYKWTVTLFSFKYTSEILELLLDFSAFFMDSFLP